MTPGKLPEGLRDGDWLLIDKGQRDHPYFIVGQVVKVRALEHFICLNPYYSTGSHQFETWIYRDEGVYYSRAKIFSIPKGEEEAYLEAVRTREAIKYAIRLVQSRTESIEQIIEMATAPKNEVVPIEFSTTLMAMMVNTLGDQDEAAIAEKFLEDIAEQFAAYFSKRRLFGMPLT